MRFRKIRRGSWRWLEGLCEVPRCLLWRGLRHHCPIYNVSRIFFNKCLYFSCYMAGHLLDWLISYLSLSLSLSHLYLSLGIYLCICVSNCHLSLESLFLKCSTFEYFYHLTGYSYPSSQMFGEETPSPYLKVRMLFVFSVLSAFGEGEG